MGRFEDRPRILRMDYQCLEQLMLCAFKSVDVPGKTIAGRGVE